MIRRTFEDWYKRVTKVEFPSLLVKPHECRCDELKKRVEKLEELVLPPTLKVYDSSGNITYSSGWVLKGNGDEIFWDSTS